MTQPELNEQKQLIEMLARIKSDPVYFVQKVIGVEPTWQQREILDAIRPHGAKVSVRSGHGIGKTSALSWAMLWFMLTQPTGKETLRIPCTAPSSHQLFDILWPELSIWSTKMHPSFSQHLDHIGDTYWIKGYREQRFAVARTARKEKPEALAGFHGDHMMFIIDEASGVEEAIFETAEGALSTEGARIIMTSNPTRTDGYFHRSQNSEREYWTTLAFSSLDSPLVDPLYPEKMKRRYGEDSSVYRVRVLGEFPEGSENAVIPLSIVEAALTRDVNYDGSFPVAGLDVARGDRDANALVIRKGGDICYADRWWSGDLMPTVGRVMAAYNKGLFKHVYVDAIGLGAGVADRLKELGCPCTAIQVSELAAYGNVYYRLRDELWFKGRDFFQEKNCKISDSIQKELRDALVGELSSVTYDYTSSGKLKVESKDEYKARLGKDGLSPNLADAFLLSLCQEGRSGQRKRAVPVQKMSSMGWT
jgi:phage terminase large subunit